MKKTSRVRARKRALPEWVVDDELDETSKSGTPDSSSCKLKEVGANDDDNSSTQKLKNEVPEKLREGQTKRPFVRPNYEYLPGNKHAQQNRINSSSLNPEVDGTLVGLSSDDVVAQTMPLIAFEGSVIYSYNVNDCSLLCEEIVESHLSGEGSSSQLNVGFDLEWPVTYQKGEGGGKVALVQVSISETTCYLFHISAIGSLPKSLKKFLEDDRVKKIGVNIENDMWKLTKDFDFDAMKVIRNSMVDLGKIANSKLKSRENWSLDGLCRNVLRMKMDKDTDIRCGKWDDFPLTEKQKVYAATDAYACLKIFNSLI